MTRQEILAVAKPILFNTEMVRAILEGHKTVTRRAIKENIEAILHSQSRACHPELCDSRFIGKLCFAPCQSGDYLYVRETWAFDTGDTTDDVGTGYFIYKADEQDSTLHHWRPSIHMPKEAARLFLRVTGVRAEQLQNITDEQILKEGIRAWGKDGKLYKYAPADSEGDAPAWPWAECPHSPKGAMKRLWDTCYASPRPVKHNGIITHYESYPWENIRETRTHKGLPWEVYGNPWVWVIEFEHVIPEEAD